MLYVMIIPGEKREGLTAGLGESSWEFRMVSWRIGRTSLKIPSLLDPTRRNDKERHSAARVFSTELPRRRLLFKESIRVSSLLEKE